MIGCLTNCFIDDQPLPLWAVELVDG